MTLFYMAFGSEGGNFTTGMGKGWRFERTIQVWERDGVACGDTVIASHKIPTITM
jgi:hypothetical protein